MEIEASTFVFSESFVEFFEKYWVFGDLFSFPSESWAGWFCTFSSDRHRDESLVLVIHKKPELHFRRHPLNSVRRRVGGETNVLLFLWQLILIFEIILVVYVAIFSDLNFNDVTHPVSESWSNVLRKSKISYELVLKLGDWRHQIFGSKNPFSY